MQLQETKQAADKAFKDKVSSSDLSWFHGGATVIDPTIWDPKESWYFKISRCLFISMTSSFDLFFRRHLFVRQCQLALAYDYVNKPAKTTNSK
jgi:hypothetical protein